MVVIAFGLLLVVLAVGRAERDHQPFPAGWVLVAVPLLVAGGLNVRHNRLEDRLSEAVKTAAGDDRFDVDCWRWWQRWDHSLVVQGSVQWGEATANVSAEVCRNADRWHRGSEAVEERVAVMILAHETAHLAGHRSESESECIAMWVAPLFAEALGAARSDGAALALWYAATINPTLQPWYRVPGCLEGDRPLSPLLS